MQEKSLEFLRLQDNTYVVLMRTLKKFLTKLEYRKQVSFLRGMKRHVIEKVLKIGLLNHEIPFLPVLQHSLRSKKKNIPLSRQISFVRRLFDNGDEKIGTFSLNLDQVSHIKVKTPHHYPYYILGVNLNPETAGLSAKEAMLIIERKGEKALNLAEAITLAIHRPELLEEYIIMACGSQYIEQKDGTIKNIPCIQLCDGRPTITWKNANDKLPRCISPSCIDRLGISILDSAKTIIQGRPWREIGPV